jgi:MoxR-like ATPase
MNDDPRDESADPASSPNDDVFNDFIEEALSEEGVLPPKEHEPDLPEERTEKQEETGEVEVPKENPLKPNKGPLFRADAAAEMDPETGKQETPEEMDHREREAQAIRGLSAAYNRMRQEIRKVIIGQHDIVDQLLIALFSRGHCLLVGVPGLAKTLLVSTIAQILQLSFRRIQFTPDLMPSDITGTDVLQDDPETGRRTFQFMQGPLFTNMLLADEINRTPPKTQAALLEAMQERHVTVGSNTYRLPQPFFVLATQNPIEQEGTYPLPEAQLDRFMFNIIVKYPNAAEELRILKQTTGGHEPELKTALTGAQILALQEVVRRVPVAEHVFIYARDLVRATRPGESESPRFVREYVSWGAGPRAGQYLILGAKARAILEGRFHVSSKDIAAVAHPVLRHRIVTNFHADSENVTSDDVVSMLLDKIPVPLEEHAKKTRRG